MKNSNRLRVRAWVYAALITLLVGHSAATQTLSVKSSSFQLGDKTVVIPAPEGFQEAASQFESIKERMSRTEDPGNDMLAVHLPNEDCEKLKHGESAQFNFYTK